ncbi:LysR family transcriptional regulator [Dysgonomonas sp. ZJ709]|uniref:LysR family transcriptional regulator n=1 Tax=Dysgonomonas sp. ZJ709 TaxID=2709797 RepID=UPI0013EA75DD|nr:LysR family transcriptional regulator [Dysgonomonas sp. ZJ709]
MINLEWYRTFNAIYQQGNMTRAALDLQISQPNVSLHLAALENHVGGKLFERVPKGLIPTELGKHLYTQITEAVQKLESVEINYSKSGLKLTSTIHLGTPYEYFYTEMTRKISHSASNIITIFGTTKELMNLLEKGDLDFVVATQKGSNNNITYEPLFKESFIIVGSPHIDFPAFTESLKNEVINDAEEWLLDQEWFAYSSDLAFIRRFWKVNFNKRPLIKPKYVIPDLNYIIKALSLGNGITVVADYLAKEFLADGRIVKIWDGVVPSVNELYLAYDKTKVSTLKVDEMKRLIL